MSWVSMNDLIRPPHTNQNNSTNPNSTKSHPNHKLHHTRYQVPVTGTTCHVIIPEVTSCASKVKTNWCLELVWITTIFYIPICCWFPKSWENHIPDAVYIPGIFYRWNCCDSLNYNHTFFGVKYLFWAVLQLFAFFCFFHCRFPVFSLPKPTVEGHSHLCLLYTSPSPRD